MEYRWGSPHPPPGVYRRTENITRRRTSYASGKNDVNEWMKWMIEIMPKSSAHVHRQMKIHTNKKVLLRERKRHTAHRVASTRRVPGPGGGTRSHVRGGGYLVTGPGGGTPSQVWEGVLRVPPPHLDLRWGTPPPPASVNRLKILPPVILRMRAVIIETINLT